MAVNKNQAGVEVADGVRVPLRHEIREAHMVGSGHSGARNLPGLGFRVEGLGLRVKCIVFRV